MVFDEDLNYLCTDQELALYDRYCLKSKQPMKLKLWVELHQDGLI